MRVEFSEDFKRQIDSEIIRLKSLIEALEFQVKGLQALLANRVPEGTLQPVKRHYKTRSKVMASIGEVTDKESAKKAYMKAYRERMKLAKSPGSPSTTNGKRKYTKRRDTGTTTVNRFTLEREFTLDDKDIGLIISYLISWKGTGRLLPGEGMALDAIQGFAHKSLSEVQRSNLRESFYSARGRIMEKARLSSEQK